MKMIFLIIVITSLALKVSGQCDATLKGTAEDKTIHKPLGGALIILFKEDHKIDSQLTDSLGRYRFENLASGSYDVMLKVKGHADKWVNNVMLFYEKTQYLIICPEEKPVRTPAIVCYYYQEPRCPFLREERNDKLLRYMRGGGENFYENAIQFMKMGRL